MNTAPSSVFASPGAQAEHYLLGVGRLADTLGRVLRARVRELRRGVRPMTHEAVGILRDATRAREAVRATAERTRILAGRPVY